MATPTLIQTLHCRHLRPRLVAEHLAIMARDAHTLWGLSFRPDVAAMCAQITALLRRERYPDAISSFVRLTLDHEGHEALQPLGTSLYEGYALRSLHPHCCTLAYRLPFDIVGSSAATACDELALSIARGRGFDAAVRCNDEGHCLALGDAPLFAVRGGELFTSSEPETASAQLLITTAGRMRLPLHIAPIRVQELARFDELFAVDPRGITSIGRCDGHPFMQLHSNRLAEEMERTINAL